MNAKVLATEFEEEKDRSTVWHWTPRRKVRVPVDEVAPQHESVHGLLLRWGAWNRQRSAGSSLASIEATYTKGDTPPATAPLDCDPDIMAAERAVIRMPKEHGATIRMIYVRRFSPFTICRAMRLRYEDFPRWVFTARAMVRNLLHRQGYLTNASSRV